jgi:hypothetical protein
MKTKFNIYTINVAFVILICITGIAATNKIIHKVKEACHSEYRPQTLSCLLEILN